MFGLFSDPHLGPGGRGDVCNREGLELVLELLFARPALSAIYALGDFLDKDRYGVHAVLDAAINRDFLCRLGRRTRERRIKFVWVMGNHDDFRVAEMPAVLAALAACGLELGEGFEIRGGMVTVEDEGQWWTVCHGHEFDRLNSGWFSPVASGLTFLSGQIGRVIPGWDDRYINPVNLLGLSAARRPDKAKALLRSRAGQYAIEQRRHLALGHTHDLLEEDLGAVHIVNTGCVTKGRAAAVVIEGGCAQLFPLQGAF